MFTQLMNALDVLLRLAIFITYGPAGALVPLCLLYGTVEFGLNFFGQRSRRERWFDGAVATNCTLGIVAWLLRDQLSAILLLLLGGNILVTIVTLIITVRGKDPLEQASPPAPVREAGEADAVPTGRAQR